MTLDQHDENPPCFHKLTQVQRFLNVVVCNLDGVAQANLHSEGRTHAAVPVALCHYGRTYHKPISQTGKRTEVCFQWPMRS